MKKKERRQREWMTRIADYKASGLTMAAWCTANHVTSEQLKYCTRKLKKIASIDAVPEATRFIPFSVAESVPSRISTSGHPDIQYASPAEFRLNYERRTSITFWSGWMRIGNGCPFLYTHGNIQYGPQIREFMFSEI